MSLDKYKILGYTNPLKINGTPINTIISRSDKIFVQFSDSSQSALDVKNIKELEKSQVFIPEKNDKYIRNDEYSYLTFDGLIFTGMSVEILDYLIEDYKKVFDHVHKRLLLKLIKKEILAIKTSEEAYKTISLNIDLFCPVLRLLITDRIKGNGEIAKRIILQHKTYNNNNFKTSFRKNLHSVHYLNNDEFSRVGLPLINNILNQITGHKIENKFNAQSDNNIYDIEPSISIEDQKCVIHVENEIIKILTESH